jgi:hypothetical protein
MLIGVLAALALSAMPQGTGQIARAPYLCNFAKVDHLKAGSYLSVRSGPGERFSMIDRLKAGRAVYTCDEHNEWYKVFYGSSDSPCGVESTSGIDVRAVSTCKFGWVNKKWVDVLSG